MIYQAYQAHADFLAPFRLAARTTRDLLTRTPFHDNVFLRSFAASCELLARAGMSHAHPPWSIDSVEIDGEPVRVHPEAAWIRPFCTLLHFRKERSAPQPRVLVVAPMSGHFATLLRGTVRTLLPDHDVYITDWHNAQDVSLLYGRFDFDDFVDHVIDFLVRLGPDTHIIAVCQPSVPVLAAVSIMAADDNPAQPPTMTLMGGPIDTRRSPTQVNAVAKAHTLDWFERTVIGTVPIRYNGACRRVYPGFMQLAGFISMNIDRHVDAHVELFHHLVKGDGESAEATRAFYDEYMAVMDLPAEFYLQTLRHVFQEHHLPDGKLVSRDRKVEPAAIRKTALLTVEGERDDICAPGQTVAAHDLVTSLPASKQKDYLQKGVGHYGVFNGRKWATEAYPVVRDWIRRHAG